MSRVTLRGRRLPLLAPTAEDRETLESWSRRRKTAQALALRSRMILRASTGLTAIAGVAELGICMQSVRKCWRRDATVGPDGLLVRPDQASRANSVTPRSGASSSERSRADRTALHTGRHARWLRLRDSTRQRLVASCAPSRFSRIGRRASNSAVILSSSTRCATSSASISIRPTVHWFCAWMRRARFNRSNALRLCCRCAPWTGRTASSRQPPTWHHPPLRRARHEDRKSDRPVVTPPPCAGVPEVPRYQSRPMCRRRRG